MELVRGDHEATSTILAVGNLVASCAKTAVGGWRAQLSIDTRAFEPDPWLWPYAAQSTKPLVWALWTTNPIGDGWQGQALDLQNTTKPLFSTQKRSKCYLLLATPDVELLVSVLKSDDVAYNLYVGVVTFQPGSCRCISELQSVEL